jgi:hypothetical protein
MVPAVTPLRSLSTARSCARIDSRPDTAKIGSADRVEVHHARLLAAIGVRKTFPHGLGQKRTLATRAGYDALRHGEILVFEPDLSALVRRNGKTVVVDLRNIHCREEMFGASVGN